MMLRVELIQTEVTCRKEKAGGEKSMFKDILPLSDLSLTSVHLKCIYSFSVLFNSPVPLFSSGKPVKVAVCSNARFKSQIAIYYNNAL